MAVRCITINIIILKSKGAKHLDVEKCLFFCSKVFSEALCPRWLNLFLAPGERSLCCHGNQSDKYKSISGFIKSSIKAELISSLTHCSLQKLISGFARGSNQIKVGLANETNLEFERFLLESATLQRKCFILIKYQTMMKQHSASHSGVLNFLNPF